MADGSAALPAPTVAEGGGRVAASAIAEGGGILSTHAMAEGGGALPTPAMAEGAGSLAAHEKSTLARSTGLPELSPLERIAADGLLQVSEGTHVRYPRLLLLAHANRWSTMPIRRPRHGCRTACEKGLDPHEDDVKKINYYFIWGKCLR